MTDKRITDLVDPARNLALPEWIDVIEDIAEDHGYFEPLGPDHSALFIEGNANLLVTFETIENARSRSSSDVPFGWELATPNGWSQLCILSQGETWFRHRAVYGYFDKLVDDGFFDEYDNVVFYGVESCGYAAAAYSVAAPGATVLALSPQASLDPRVCEWDDRFHHMRRTSFTDRYGFAPDMLQAADKAFVLYDPEIEEDAMHSALFIADNVARLRFRHIGAEIEPFLRRMEVLSPLLTKAMNGSLKVGDFHTAYRERRSYLPYLRNLLTALEESERPFLTAMMCRNVLERVNTPRFRRQLSLAEKELKAQGRALPKPALLELV